MSIKFSAALLALAGMFLVSHGALADDRAPKVDTTKPTAVVYPASAQRAGEEGTVVLKVHVVESGTPDQVSMAKSSGFVDLDNAAIETVMNWHYVPAVRSGAITDDWALVQVVYKLPEGAQPAPAK
jgi:TonB family protein